LDSFGNVQVHSSKGQSRSTINGNCESLSAKVGQKSYQLYDLNSKTIPQKQLRMTLTFPSSISQHSPISHTSLSPTAVPLILTVITKNNKQNSRNDKEDAGGEQVREMLENVFSVVEFNDRNHGRRDDDGEQHRKVGPEGDCVVEVRVDPWQEKQISET
jgi:hypothetical protein